MQKEVVYSIRSLLVHEEEDRGPVEKRTYRCRIGADANCGAALNLVMAEILIRLADHVKEIALVKGGSVEIICKRPLDLEGLSALAGFLGENGYTAEGWRPPAGMEFVSPSIAAEGGMTAAPASASAAYN